MSTRKKKIVPRKRRPRTFGKGDAVALLKAEIARLDASKEWSDRDRATSLQRAVSFLQGLAK